MTSLADSAGLSTEITLEGAEHILIEDELSNETAKPRTLARRRLIRNHTRGTRTEISLYAEGVLRLREGTSKRVMKDHLIELEFLDPAFERHRSFARGWLWSLAGSAGLGALAWLVLPWLDLQTFTPWVIAALLPVAAVSLRCFVRGSQVALTFHTMTGRAEVLRLTANFGCVRNFRRAARDISAAIRQARAADKFGDSRFLRMEMQAHYRLLESGVIGREACSRGTAKILARFG